MFVVVVAHKEHQGTISSLTPSTKKVAPGEIVAHHVSELQMQLLQHHATKHRSTLRMNWSMGGCQYDICFCNPKVIRESLLSALTPNSVKASQNNSNRST